MSRLSNLIRQKGFKRNLPKSLQASVPPKSFGLAEHTAGRRKDPTEFGFVFVVGVGRDGTTLVQRLLNSSPKVLVRGENVVGLQLAALARKDSPVEVRIRKKVRKGVQTLSHHPWFGVEDIDLARVRGRLQRTIVEDIIRPDVHHTTIGFKEIRWFDVPGSFSGINRLFSAARWIFVEKSPDLVAKSGWWVDVPNAVPEIRRRYKFHQAMAREIGSRSLTLRSQDLDNGPRLATTLSSFLEVDYSPSSISALLEESLDHSALHAPWHVVNNTEPKVL